MKTAPSKVAKTIAVMLSDFQIIRKIEGFLNVILEGGTIPVVSDLAVSVRNSFSSSFRLPVNTKIKDSEALLESGILDSLGVLEVVAFIEQEYSIHVSDDDFVLENFRSIDRIAAFILSRM